MAKTKEQKKQVIETIKNYLKNYKTMCFIDFSGIKAADLFNLRKKIKKDKGLIYIAKKNLIDIAFRQEGISLDVKSLKGQLGIVFSPGEKISALKTLYNFFNEQGLTTKILAGFWQEKFIEAEKVIELAKLPSKQELQTQLVNNLSLPILNFVNVLGENIRLLIYALNAIK